MKSFIITEITPIPVFPSAKINPNYNRNCLICSSVNPDGSRMTFEEQFSQIERLQTALK